MPRAKCRRNQRQKTEPPPELIAELAAEIEILRRFLHLRHGDREPSLNEIEDAVLRLSERGRFRIRVKSGHKADSKGSGCGCSGPGRSFISSTYCPKQRMCSRVYGLTQATRPGVTGCLSSAIEDRTPSCRRHWTMSGKGSAEAVGGSM